MNYPLLSIYLVSITLMIATPGPVVAFVLNAAARGGFRQALLTALGTNWASLVLIATASFVIMGLLTINHTFLSWISFAVCIFLGWTAITGLISGFASPENSGNGISPNPSTGLSGVTPIFRGFLVGISNPKDIIFFVAFFPQFIGITNQVKTSLAVLTALWILCDFTILLGYATITSTGTFRRRQRWISILSSGFLLIVAIAGFTYTFMSSIGRNSI